MSYVTKFGVSNKFSSKTGPPGTGFKITREGNYDIDKKKLRNVDDAVEDSDAVTKKQSLTINSSNYYDANRKRIGNVASPEVDSDAVNLHYASNYFLNLRNDKYDAKFKQICKVAEPENSEDVVTKSYLEKRALSADDDEDFDARNKRIKNLSDPVNDTNVSNKKYVDNLTKIEDVPENSLVRNADGLFVPRSIKLTENYFDAENNEIRNVAEPQHDSSVVTKSYLHEVSLTGVDHYNANRKRIGNLGHPRDDRNAATKKYVDDLTNIDQDPKNGLVRNNNGLFVMPNGKSEICLVFGDGEVMENFLNAHSTLTPGTLYLFKVYLDSEIITTCV